ncbi:MAG: DUF1501 domain-containing protein [Burkholderiaceae bacterium]|nr:MAG: DUF1501 domain-containing protein [Burkholderiaceae bacterium]
MAYSPRRRQLLKAVGSAGLLVFQPAWAQTLPTGYDNRLILIELKGGNDGLNTVVPYADSNYSSLRPRLALTREQVLPLTESVGLHEELKPLLELWNNKNLAIVQGVGYPQPNLSHFRSIEIWDTASNSTEYLDTGWLGRAFEARPVPQQFAAAGAVIGSAEMGPLLGGARTVAIADTERFVQQAHLAAPRQISGNAALTHVLETENDIVHAATQMTGQYDFKTEFPPSGFGATVKTAMHVLAAGFDTQTQRMRSCHVAAMRLTLSGFDTHQNQPGTHANLLRQLSEGMVALKAALQELNAWDSTLIMTYAEFGRRPKENMSNGTDHGTVAPHFVTGGRVRGGLYGQPPILDRLDGSGNLAYAVDFRSLYSTVLNQWWGIPATNVLQGNFSPLPFLRS